MLQGEAEGLFADFVDRGWNDTTKVCLLAQFVADEGLQEKLNAFLTDVAAEEEGECNAPSQPQGTAVRQLDTLDREELVRIVRSLQDVLWGDDEAGKLNRHTVWDAETIERVAEVLENAGLAPEP